MSLKSKNGVPTTLQHRDTENRAFTSHEHVNRAPQAATVDARVSARVRGLGFVLNPVLVLILSHSLQVLESPFEEVGIHARQADGVTSLNY